MGLTLRIENETSLPDGGPLDIRISGQRGIDIGRDPHLDWTLPDPSRYISGKHCEVRFENGHYILYDVSTNGTFVNGSDRRMQGPHRLCTGDRILIGNYIVVAEVDTAARAERAPPLSSMSPPAYGDIWNGEAAAPPVSRDEFVVRPERPRQPDFLDWAADLPAPGAGFERGVEAPRPDYAARTPPSQSVWVESSMPAGAWAFDQKSTPPVPSPGGAARVAPPVAPPVAAPLAAPRPAARAEPSLPSFPEVGPLARAEPASATDSGPRPDEPSRPEAALRPDSWSARPAMVPPPPPPPLAPPAPAPSAAMAGETISAEAALAIIARAAGVPVDTFTRRGSEEMLGEIGLTLRVVVQNMMQLLAARTSTKRTIRSGEHTVISALDNNPLKFSPTPEEALRILFGPATPSYLGGSKALASGFQDIGNHQVRIFGAIQQALQRLVEDIDPATVEKAAPPGGGVKSLFTSHKARLWDQYAAAWRAKVQRHDDGVIGLFMLYFADCYDRFDPATDPAMAERRRRGQGGAPRHGHSD